MANVISQIVDKYQGLASGRVIHAVADAAKRTGTDFSFLMEKAAAESGFKSDAKAKSSSATGLFQFIDSTWLMMVKQYGAKYGLGEMADKIEVKGGRACVGDCEVKKEILDLRKNPEISALMAGEFSADNRDYLEAHTEGKVGRTEMYLAHFLGAGSAAKFINTRAQHGDMAAADVFPREAAANKNVFFAADGRARSLDEVYARFASKFNGDKTAPASSPAPAAPVQVASSSAYSSSLAQARTLFSAGSCDLPLPVESLLIMAQMQTPDMFARRSSESSFYRG